MRHNEAGGNEREIGGMEGKLLVCDPRMVLRCCRDSSGAGEAKCKLKEALVLAVAILFGRRSHLESGELYTKPIALLDSPTFVVDSSAGWTTFMWRRRHFHCPTVSKILRSNIADPLQLQGVRGW